MDVWLIHGNDHIRPSLEQMMPGLQWLDWKPKHLVSRHKLQEAAKAIEAHLEALPSTINSLSTQALRKALKLDISRNYFTRVLWVALDNHGGWDMVERGIERREPDYSVMFQNAA